MPTNYPDDYDGFANPNSFTTQSQVPHANQHADANDAIEALEHTLGLLPQGDQTTVADRLSVLEDNVEPNTVVSDDITEIVVLTQAEYDALSPPDEALMYVVVG